MQFGWWRSIVALTVLALLLSGCQVVAQLLPQRTSPTEEMLPDLPDYDVVEDETLTAYISGLSEGAALLSGHPELAATIEVVDQIIGCYQDVGAVQGRVYSHKEMPLQAGVVAIADRNALMDPVTLFRCLSTAKPDVATAEITIQPCAGSYTLTRDGNEFYIAYAGTTAEVCETLCAHLEGCEEQATPTP